MATRKQPTTGVKEGRPSRLLPYHRAYLRGKRDGIRKVVEWMLPRIATNNFGILQTNIDAAEWLTKLKEWGIEWRPSDFDRILQILGAGTETTFIKRRTKHWLSGDPELRAIVKAQEEVK